MRVKTLLFLLGLSFILIALSSCGQKREHEEAEARKTEAQKVIEETDYKITYLSYPTVYLIEFRGHEYLTRGSSSRFLHVESCPHRSHFE